MEILSDTKVWGVLYVASEWIIRLVMLVVVPFRRSPEAAKGWLLLVLFLPWVGLVLYLIIGRPEYPRWRVERFARLPELFRPIRERLVETAGPFHAQKITLHAPTHLVTNLGMLRPLGGNVVELLSDYDDAIDRLVADIDAATDHVHLLYYIFADDETGGKVVAALSRATARGVTCRVLVDFLGSKHGWRSLSEKLKAAGVTAHRVLPITFLRRKSARGDLRNHRKIAVIDAQVAYTGSQNIVDSTFKAGMTFEELVVRVTGPAVLELQAVFVADWYLEREELLDGPHIFPCPEATGAVVAQVMPSGPDYPSSNVERLVVSLAHAARKRLVITTPYFIPSESLLQALESAVCRGVEVHLVISMIADQVLVSLAQRSYYEELLEAGVHIHRYREKFLHAKHLSVDDELVVIGSSNLDIRSFLLNAEVSLVVYDRDVAHCLRAHQERYFAGSELLLRDQWESRSGVQKVCENLARLMSPLL